MNRLSDRGFAVVTALMIAVLMLIIGLTLLSLVETDNHFTIQQETVLRAKLAARSGLEMFKQDGDQWMAMNLNGRVFPLDAVHPPPPPGWAPTQASPYVQNFSVTLDVATNNVTSTGTVYNAAGTVLLASCTLRAYQGDFTQIVEVGP